MTSDPIKLEVDEENESQDKVIDENAYDSAW